MERKVETAMRLKALDIAADLALTVPTVAQSAGETARLLAVFIVADSVKPLCHAT